MVAAIRIPGSDRAHVVTAGIAEVVLQSRFDPADIVTEVQLPEGIVCNSTLWAACIGGAMQQDDYRSGLERAGLRIRTLQDNPSYRFISDNAQGASRKFGVKSVSLVADKPAAK